MGPASTDPQTAHDRANGSGRRIAPKDGAELNGAPSSPTMAADDKEPLVSTAHTPDAEAIRSALRLVMDPEVGMNIVDLGLIYKIECAPGKVYIEMTMTSPACPLADMILDDVDSVLDPMLPPEIDIRVELVWDPPWTPERMAPEARDHFGWNR